MNREHEPRPEFISQLEWQVQTAMRRRDRFSMPTERSYGMTVKLIALILISVFTGAAGVVAKDEVQQSRNREILLARIETQLNMADLQLQIVRTTLEEVRRHYQTGVAGEEEVLEAEVAYREAETQVMALRLDQEEIRLSGREPSNELSAPLVDGRDFVTERLRLREMVAEEHLSLVRHQFNRVEDLVEVGAVGDDEMRDRRLALLEAEYQVASVLHRMDLRRRFLEGEFSLLDVEREYELNEIRGRLEVQELAYENERRRVERMEVLVQRGVMAESQLERARLELQMRELEIALIGNRLAELMETWNRNRGSIEPTP